MKKCIKCGKEKPFAEYHKRASAKDGLQSQCKECNIARVKKWQEENADRHKENWQRHTANRNRLVSKARQYNIAVEDLDALFSKAKGTCEICKRKPDRWVVIDHCHNSLKVRGILCERCNQALGLFGDNIDILSYAIDYLKREALVYENFTPMPRQKYD